MSADQMKESALEKKVRERKEAAKIQGIKPNESLEKPLIEKIQRAPEPAEITLPKPAEVLVTTNTDVKNMIDSAVEAIDQNKNPMQIARILAAIQATGLKNRPLATELGKSEAWLSKRLGLLKASAEVQKQIEAGSITEYEYYNHRDHVEGQANKQKRQTAKYARMPSVTISIETAQVLTEILKRLAYKHGLSPITVDKKSTKKDLISALTLRAQDVLRVVK